jgi:hypothetical protein
MQSKDPFWVFKGNAVSIVIHNATNLALVRCAVFLHHFADPDGFSRLSTCMRLFFGVPLWILVGYFRPLLPCGEVVFAVLGGFQHHKPQFRGFPGTRF